MNSKTMSLKSKINNYAKKINSPSQIILQNYMFERFLERVSVSQYSDKFIVKGGHLISSLIGNDIRSTMDLDATIINLSVEKTNVLNVISEILTINIGDEVSFNLISIKESRLNNLYGGYQIRINAVYYNITTCLSIDISAGDIITPHPYQYCLSGMLDQSKKIAFWGYNMETVLAEKVETILTRGIFNTRPRDYYDVYIITKTQEYDQNLFNIALRETSTYRKSYHIIKQAFSIIEELNNNEILNNNWSKYQKKFYYAKDISFSETLDSLKKLLKNFDVT